MAECRRVKLGDVIAFQRGFDIVKRDQTPGPYPVISSGGPTSTHNAHRYPGPGVIIGRKGTLGNVYWSDGPCWPHDTTLWVKDFKDNYPKYIYYFLQTLKLERFDVGASNPTLNRNHLHLLDVDVLVPQVQKPVAHILCTFDDLIENNRRRIEILEEMARLLYREWFVHFRYPGHEGVELVDSELGPIPIGWTTKALGEVVENFDRKRVPLSKMEREHRQGPYPYYGAARIFDYVDDYIFDGEYLLFGEDGTVVDPSGGPMLQLVGGRFWCNNHAHVLRGSEVSTRRLWCALKGFPIAGHITGAAQPKVTQANMNRIAILVPPPAIGSAFDEAVDPLIDLWFNLRQQNRVLREARDLLLPRLVSGELDVSDLDLDGVLA